MPCYLLHFELPLGNLVNPRGQARHYLGSTEHPIHQRIKEYLFGRGAKITAAAIKQGIKLNCVRVWSEGSRDLEIWLKETHNNALYCPICNLSIELKVKRLIVVKDYQQQIKELGIEAVLSVLSDAAELENIQNVADQIREILFYLN